MPSEQLIAYICFISCGVFLMHIFLRVELLGNTLLLSSYIFILPSKTELLINSKPYNSYYLMIVYYVWYIKKIKKNSAFLAAIKKHLKVALIIDSFDY